MLNCITCNNRILNTKLNDYCRNVMNDSIKKITEKYNLERKNKAYELNGCAIIEKPNYEMKDNNFILFGLFSILSIFTITTYFYRKN